MTRFLPTSLRIRMLLYGSLLVVAAMTLVTYLNFHSGEQMARGMLETHMFENAWSLVSLAEREPEMAVFQAVLERLDQAAQPGHEVLLVDREGLVVAASNPQAVGRPIEEAVAHVEPGLRAVLAGEVPYASQEMTHRGLRVIDLTLPVHGDPTTPTAITGALHYVEPRAEYKNLVRGAFFHGLLLTLLLLLLLLVPLYLFTSRAVLAPLQRLAESNRAVAEGRAEATFIPEKAIPANEIGEIMRTRNAMLARLTTYTHELAALFAISRAVAQSLVLDEVLELALDETLAALGVEAGGILLLETDGETLTLRAHRGLSEQFLEAVRSISVGEGLSGRAVVAKEPQMLDVSDYPSKRLAPFIVQEGFQSLASAPLLSKGRALGVLTLGTRRRQAFSSREVALLGAIGQQVGVAVENAQLYELLAAEQQRLETLVEQLPVGVILLDIEGRILLANPVAREYLPLLTDATVGEILTRLGDLVLTELLQARAGGWIRDVIIESVPQRIFEVTMSPPPPGGVIVLRDVTREREIQQQQRLAAVGQLAAGIAHDFNNILQGLIGFSQLLAQRPDIPEDARQRLRMMAEQGEQGARLVRRILDFSRQSVSRRQPLDLLPFLKEMIRLLRHTIPEHIRIELAAEPGSYTVLADPTQLQQVITNLATNARDAMPKGGTLTIELERLRVAPGEQPPLSRLSPGKWVVLRVVDTGTGIAPEHLPHIFEPFYTTKEVGQGTGLGLSQVYGIVQQHDGHLNVQSQVGQGTTFTIYLPEREATEGAPRIALSNGVTRGAGQMLLVVEDDPQVLEIVCHTLEDLGYRTVGASSGEEALEVYRARATEIMGVVTDVVMRGMSGIELARAVHKECGGRVPVVAMTGHPLREEEEATQAPHIAAWLRKPFTEEDLAQALAKALGEA